MNKQETDMSKLLSALIATLAIAAGAYAAEVNKVAPAVPATQEAGKPADASKAMPAKADAGQPSKKGKHKGADEGKKTGQK